jgi:RNase P/RNase MRP subunit p30
MVDLVYGQPLIDLLQLSTYFKEKTIVLVTNELQEKKVKQASLIPCYLIDESTKDIQKLSKKLKAVIGGSIEKNEFAVKIKANFLLSPSGTKQFFDLGLAKKLSDNNSTVVLMLEDLMAKNSFERHQIWKNYLDIANFCNNKKTKFIVVSGNKETLNLRPKESRIALAKLLLLNDELIKNSFEQKFD